MTTEAGLRGLECDPLSAADITANIQLVLLEREARDRGWWETEKRMFFSDSIVKVSWFDGSGDGFVTASSKSRPASGASQGGHRLGPPVVHAFGPRSVVTLPAIIWTRSTIRGIEADYEGSLRLLYRTEKRQGRWGIRSMQAIYETDTLRPAIVGQRLDVSEEELATFRPSYRALSFSFAERGRPLNQDAVGDDQPQGVEALYAETFAWARETATVTQ